MVVVSITVVNNLGYHRVKLSFVTNMTCGEPDQCTRSAEENGRLSSIQAYSDRRAALVKAVNEAHKVKIMSHGRRKMKVEINQIDMGDLFGVCRGTEMEIIDGELSLCSEYWIIVVTVNDSEPNT